MQRIASKVVGHSKWYLSPMCSYTEELSEKKCGHSQVQALAIVTHSGLSTWQQFRPESHEQAHFHRLLRRNKVHRRQPCSRLLPYKWRTERIRQVLTFLYPMVGDLRWQLQCNKKRSSVLSSGYEVGQDWSTQIRITLWFLAVRLYRRVSV